MKILIISSVEDVHAQAVMESLREQGAATELLDLSEFPAKLALTMEFAGRDRRFVLTRSGGGTLDLSTINAVWWRRPQPYGIAAGVTRQARRFAYSEASTAISGLYQSMDAFWINDPRRDEAANHKPWQLTIAQQVGLEIPPTMMTNDPEEAKDFWRRYDNNIIYKIFRALPEAWRETRRLKPEDAALADSVKLTPIIFQPFVEAVADVRVTVIGNELFAGSADAREGEYPADFRFNLNLKWLPHRLPWQIEDKLRDLMGRLGLEYGAIDLRLTPAGDYVFLEINPAGQFMWVELATNQRISAALASHLMAGRPAERTLTAAG